VQGHRLEVFVVAKDAGGWTIRAAQNADIVEGAPAPAAEAIAHPILAIAVA